MPTLHLLGTGASLSDAHRTTTMLALSDDAGTLLIDCGGDVIQRVLAAGLEIASIRGLILTHEHPDHVGGFALFMEKIFIAGTHASIPIYGPVPALDQARRCFAAYDTSRWIGLPEMRWHPVDDLVLDDASWRITAAPVTHSVPTIGMRIEVKSTGFVLAYSCDTEPADSVVELARDADLLVHEATGEFPNHSSAQDAARIASRAGAKDLVLVHLPPGLTEEKLQPARAVFAKTRVGQELEAIELGTST
ncbi:MAG: MBL fold metallo-hydrolase [Rhodothermales bacterium]